jgi:hypothetical protein
MIDVIEAGIKLTIKFDKGSYSYTHLKPDAQNAALFEVADALNSLQQEQAKSISKTMTRKLVDLG